MNKYALLLFLPIFLVFFVWGLQVGNKLDTDNIPSNENQITEINHNITSLPDGQKSILIFIVSQLDIQEPDLVGVWMMSYMSSEPYATVFAVYPSTLQHDASFDKQMLDSFKLRRVDGIPVIDDNFINDLNRSNIWAERYLAIDLTGLEKILETSLEDVDPETRHSRLQLLDQISQINEPNISRLISQTIIFQQICNEYTAITSTDKLRKLKDLYPYHISGNLDLDELMDEWQKFIKSQNGSFCVFPQKDTLLQSIY